MPERGFQLDGWRTAEQMRVRQGWFRAVIEELWEHEDGRREWRRLRPWRVLPVNPCLAPMPSVKPTRGRRPTEGEVIEDLLRQAEAK